MDQPWSKYLLLCCLVFKASTSYASKAMPLHDIKKEDLFEGTVRVVPPFDRVLSTPGQAGIE